MNKNTRKERHKTRWAKSTYAGRLTKFITKLIKYSNLRVSFKTENTIGKLLALKKNPNKMNKCGVYQLTCHDCNRTYLG